MSFTSKHNHVLVSDYPTYQVTYESAKNMMMDHVFPVSWCGAYDGKYGRTPYVDVEVQNGHTRVRLPKWSLEDIESISRDKDDMEEIKAGRIGIEFHPYTSKSGNETVHFTWHEKDETENVVDTDKLPF